MFFICIIIGIIIFASVYIFQVILANRQLEKAMIRFNLTLKQIMEYRENNKFNIDTKEFEMLLNSNYELLKDSINNSIKISMDNITFWFGFLSIIMVVFSILGIFMNNEYLERSKLLFQNIEEESAKKREALNYFYLGLQYFNIGDYKNSILNYTQAINLDNNNFKAYSSEHLWSDSGYGSIRYWYDDDGTGRSFLFGAWSKAADCRMGKHDEYRKEYASDLPMGGTFTWNCYFYIGSYF